jgi:ABC-2 type transport system ATP-binding protein
MTDAVIEVENLSKRFGGVVAVERLDFSVKRGSTTALLGANGAGKSTTIAMLLGLLLPTTGKITVLGEDILKHRHRVLPRMNFTSPYVDLPHRLTVRENLLVFGRLYGVPRLKQRVAEVAEEMRIGELLKRATGSLSAGQKTRVALAKSLLNEPEVLLMDEPTASLDPDMADVIRSYLEAYQRRTGATILLASHNMAEVERLCSTVLMMKGGAIADRGTPAELIARYGRKTLEEVFLTIVRQNGDEAREQRKTGT